VPCVHGDDGNADRIGSFDGRSGGGVGEQASLEGNRDEDVSKTARGQEVVVWSTREFFARNAGARAERSRKNPCKENWS
jgi:hypothetical protein